MADDNDGYVSIADGARFGIAQTFFSDLVDQGLFIRVAKGLYIKKGYEVDPYYLLHYTYKKAVFGYRSSLYLHGLGKNPVTPDVNLPPNYMTSGIEGYLCRHLGKKEYETGLILTLTPKGNLVPCYDLERLFIDTLRKQEDFGKEEFRHLLSQMKEKGLYKDKLISYARIFHVEELVLLGLKFI